MGIFAGLTANGLRAAIGRSLVGGHLPTGIAGPGGRASPIAAVSPAAPAGLRDHLGAALDPQRIALIQATLAGDHDAVSRMTEPLRRQRLARRAAFQRRRLEDESRMPIVADDVLDGPAVGPGGAGGTDTDPTLSPAAKLRPKSAGAASLNQDDPMTRQMITVTPDQQGQGVMDSALCQVHRAAEEAERIRRAMIVKGVNGYGYLPTKEDYNLLARAVFAEGRGTPADMEALAYAIVNRVRPRNSSRQGPELGPSLRNVLSVPSQFSFWPNARQPEGSDSWVLSAHPERMNAQDRESWNTALAVAERALSGFKPDPTRHASFFFASPDYDGRSGRVPPFFRDAIEDRRLIPSPYRSPYQGRGNPWANHFFEHADDRRPPKR